MPAYLTTVQRLPHLINTHFVEVPPEIINQLGGKLKVRLLCTLNGTLTFQCGLVALGNGSAYITLTKKRMQDAGLRFLDQVHVSLELDNSEYGTLMPEELAEVLHQDPQADVRF